MHVFRLWEESKASRKKHSQAQENRGLNPEPNHTTNIQNRYRIKLIAVLGESSICVSFKYMEWTGIYLFINTGSQSTVNSAGQ